jgi:hypothetical protein
MSTQFNRLCFCVLLLPLGVAITSGCNQKKAPSAKEFELPFGNWSGTVGIRNVPDVEASGPWQQPVVISHCPGSLTLQTPSPDKPDAPRKPLTQVSYERTHVLLMFNSEDKDPNGWIESHAWTLVENTPKDWTVSISRSVLNRGLALDAPWRTYRSFGEGRLEFAPGVRLCSPKMQ